MKRGIIITILSLFLVLAGATACNPFGGDKEEVSQQLVKVVRGDLTIDISGSGNIKVSRDVKLSFGSGGRIDKISVEKGDEIKQGEVLAELDTDALELAVTQAEVALAEKKLAVTKAEVALTEQQVAVTQAEVTLETAEYNLYEAKDEYVWVDIRTAQSDVDEAQRYLDDALWNLDHASGTGVEYQQKIVIHAQSRLDTAKDILEAMLAGTDPQEVVIKRLEVKLAQESLELAQQSLELAQQSLELAQQSLKEAEQSLKQARKQLDEATIIAPFSGVAASVFVDEGDTISAATAIIHLVDLTTLELEVEVDEIDIPGVKPGQRAFIDVDALPGIELEGKVTAIYPLPTEEGGVVLYNVKINFDVTEDAALKVGMSASVDIITDKRSNVLLVPDRAITQDSQGNPMIKVMVNEEIEERAVVTGISDGFETEIVSGLLVEGEVVVVEKRAR